MHSLFVSLHLARLFDPFPTAPRRFSRRQVFNIRTLALYGGVGKWEMAKALKESVPELVIATPGRLIEMVRNKATNLRRCTIVVLDEADRMFEMGFEYQVMLSGCG